MNPYRNISWAVGLGVLTVLGASGAWADGPAAPVVVRSANPKIATNPEVWVGARTYPYRDWETYVVVARPGRITDIVLQVGERLVGTGPIAAGDTARWVIGDTVSGADGAQRVHVMIKPSSVGLATNLIINTDRRSYYLELRSAAQTWLTAVAWRYPDPPPVAVSSAPMASVLAGAPDLAVARLNFAYRIEGAKVSWRPTRVFDDGVRTYVEFAPSIAMTDLPPLFAVGADGKSSELVNYHVAGQRIVVDRILDRAELRLGQGRGERRVRLLREPVR
jgi:P-type conjugative transfer protein TrbG